jgi:hypothetical protein
MAGNINPSQGRPPAGWTLPRGWTPANYWASGGCIAILLASVLPFIHATTRSVLVVGADISPVVRVYVALYAAAMLGVSAAATRISPHTLPLLIVLLCWAALGAIGSVLFLIAGTAGIPVTAPGLDDQATIGFSPDMGLTLLITGAGTVVASTIKLITRHGTLPAAG